MRSRRYVLLALGFVLVLAAIAAVLRACTAAEHPSAYYPSYLAADGAGALEPRGWIPGWVPESAYDIHDQHAVDSPSRCIRFLLPEPGLGEIRKVLRPLDESEVQSLDAKCRFGPEWWFDGLVQQHPAHDNGLNAELYRAVDAGGNVVFVAIERTSNRVFLWSR